MPRSGYTLLELMVVLVLLALVAGGVLVSVKEPLRRARGNLAIDEWKAIDSQLREQAIRTQRPVWLVAHPRRHAIERVATDRQGRANSQRLPLSGTWTSVATSARQEGDGTVKIPFWPNGQSSTYAVEIPDQRGRPQWLALAGVTGQPVVMTDAAVVQNILGRARPFGADAR
jgi:prepilin-type N-terminal cleavage/methylation domain-containing protein